MSASSALDHPQTTLWGPHLWMILHSAAERFGSLSLKRLPQEEQRIWGGLLASLRYSLPCPRCKLHYTEYGKSHPLIIKKHELRTWLYELHNDVNRRLERPCDVALDGVEERYQVPFHFSKHCAVVQEQMARAIRRGICTREDVQRTLRFLEELKRFYDFF